MVGAVVGTLASLGYALNTPQFSLVTLLIAPPAGALAGAIAGYFLWPFLVIAGLFFGAWLAAIDPPIAGLLCLLVAHRKPPNKGKPIHHFGVS